MKKALIPGSFDPITVGLAAIIRRAAKIFDKVYVAVMTNDMRKYVSDARVKSYMFDMTERYEMVRLACAEISNETGADIEVVCSDGMLVDLVDELLVDVIVKGVRNETDFLYEQKHALWNRAYNERAETLYMPSEPFLDNISSTYARELIASGQPTDGVLPGAVEEYLKKRQKQCL